MNLIIILEDDIPIGTSLEETYCSVASTSISLEHMKDVICDSKSMSFGVSVLLLVISEILRAICLLRPIFQLNIPDVGWLALQHTLCHSSLIAWIVYGTMFLKLSLLLLAFTVFFI